MGKPMLKVGGNAKGAKRRKNAGVGVDFKRVKAKVGKKLKKAQNETDASFKSATINLPSQTVAQDKDGVATNHQNLTLQELLVQSGHYSEKMRRNALAGLCDFFAKHPEELSQHSHAFFTKVAERVADGDASVRQALRVLLSEHVLSKLRAASVRPFMPVIMAHLAGAMTNLNIQVRLDALSFLDVLMCHVPQLVVAVSLSPCLQHFCDLLSQSHRGRSVSSQSISALLKVVGALNAFLKRAFNDEDGSPGSLASDASGAAGPGPLSAAMAQITAQATPLLGSAVGGRGASSPVVLMASRMEWPATPPLGPPRAQLRGARAATLAGVAAGDAGVGGASGRKPPRFARASADDASDHVCRLLELLFDCWAECGPSKTVEKPELEPLQVLSGIMSAATMLINRLLLRRASSAIGTMKVASEDLPVLAWVSEVVLKRVPQHFPAFVPSVKPNEALSDAMVAYNLRASQLLGMLVPVAAMHGDVPPPWLQTLLHFYLRVLEHGEVVPAAGGLSEASSLAGPTTNASYLAVLRGVSAVLCALPAHLVAPLVGAVHALAVRLPARSPVRGACVRLQHALMCAVRGGALPVGGDALGQMVQPLPKLLWELGGANAATSDTALRMLLDAARFSRPGEPLAASLEAMQAHLGPLFCLHMPAAGGKGQQSPVPAAGTAGHPSGGCNVCGKATADAAAALDAAREHAAGAPLAPRATLTPGPVAKLPRDTQMLAVDLVYHLGSLDTTLLKALAAAVHDARVLADDDIALRLVDVTLECMRTTELSRSVSWALTLLLTSGMPGGSTSGSGGVGGGSASWSSAVWLRTQAVTDVVCRALPGLAPMRSLMVLMAPQLELLLAGGPVPLTDQQRYSLVRLATTALTPQPGREGGTPLPAAVQAFLPVVCLDLYASASLSYGQYGGGNDGGLGVFNRGAPVSAASEYAAGLVLPLLQAQPQQLVPQLLAEASQWGRGMAHVGKISNVDMQEHSGACFQARFRAAASLLQHVLRSRPLVPALLCEAATVGSALAFLIAHGQQHPQLSGDTACRQECTRLQQLRTDVLG